MTPEMDDHYHICKGKDSFCVGPYEKESGTRRGLEGVSYTDGSGRTLAVNAQANEQGAVAEVERKREELLRPALDTTAEAITAGSVILA